VSISSLTEERSERLTFLENLLCAKTLSGLLYFLFTVILLDIILNLSSEQVLYFLFYYLHI
jgi:hypothetical protein